MATEIKISKPIIPTTSANYKIKILSSLAAQACTWNTTGSPHDHTHEPLARHSSSSSEGDDLRKRDKKAVVKILQRNGEIYSSSNFKPLGFNGRSILSAAFAKAFMS
jgi:hypothetical protein